LAAPAKKTSILNSLFSGSSAASDESEDRLFCVSGTVYVAIHKTPIFSQGYGCVVFYYTESYTVSVKKGCRMPVEIDWGDQEETLLVIKIRGEWNASQLFTAQQKGCSLAETKPHLVDVIADMRAASVKMTGLVPLSRRAIQIRPTNLGYVAIITTTNYWAQIYRAVPDTLKQALNIGFVNDVDAAYAAITAHRKQRRSMTDDTLA
jgi:hypothetical protein